MNNNKKKYLLKKILIKTKTIKICNRKGEKFRSEKTIWLMSSNNILEKKEKYKQLLNA